MVMGREMPKAFGARERETERDQESFERIWI